ncbi:unnamed protein product [Amoebophrya sp. A25]|nr:unnamed protein product [Amoebophrya sp. A25]|eukprot:GSA25T00014271001.1
MEQRGAQEDASRRMLDDFTGAKKNMLTVTGAKRQGDDPPEELCSAVADDGSSENSMRLGSKKSETMQVRNACEQVPMKEHQEQGYNQQSRTMNGNDTMGGRTHHQLRDNVVRNGYSNNIHTMGRRGSSPRGGKQHADHDAVFYNSTDNNMRGPTNLASSYGKNSQYDKPAKMSSYQYHLQRQQMSEQMHMDQQYGYHQNYTQRSWGQDYTTNRDGFTGTTPSSQQQDLPESPNFGRGSSMPVRPPPSSGSYIRPSPAERSQNRSAPFPSVQVNQMHPAPHPGRNIVFANNDYRTS